jgi:large subunit ribosomal protein L5
MSYIPTLKKKYTEQVVPALKEKYNYKSVMQVPKLSKIVINQGVGAAVGDKKLIDNAIDEISRISGQKAVATKSKKAISNFKLKRRFTNRC